MKRKNNNHTSSPNKKLEVHEDYPNDFAEENSDAFEQASGGFREFAKSNEHMQKYIASRIKLKADDYESKLITDKKLVNDLRESKEQYVVIMSTSNVAMEEKIIKGLIKEQSLPANYFILNNSGNHWDTKKISELSEVRIAASGKDLACGCYAILQILAHRDYLPSQVNEILLFFPEDEQQKIKTAFEDVKRKTALKEKYLDDLGLDSELARKFVAQIILHSSHIQKDIKYKNINNPSYRLSTDDITAVFNSLGIKHIERAALNRAKEVFGESDNQHL